MAKHTLKLFLENTYQRYHHPDFIRNDPLVFARRCRTTAEREIAGLLAAVLAYGNVKSIHAGVGDALRRMGERPARYLAETRPHAIRRDFADFRYRVTSGPKLAALLIGVQRVLHEHGSLNRAFLDAMIPAEPNIVTALEGWVRTLANHADDPLDHLLPRPTRGSACKRLMLYLRWMVRRDTIDPGGWRGIAPAQLIIPMDTHMKKVAATLGLTRRRVANLATAVEVTRHLATVRPDDPLRYDFALTRPGILALVFPSTATLDSGDSDR